MGLEGWEAPAGVPWCVGTHKGWILPISPWLAATLMAGASKQIGSPSGQIEQHRTAPATYSCRAP